MVHQYATVVESADTLDSKSIAEKRVGSSPTTDTKYLLNGVLYEKLYNI